MDISIEAIEADLALAERNGASVKEVAFARANVTATLLARTDHVPGVVPDAPIPNGLDIQIVHGPFGDTFSVPLDATQKDRLEAAAVLLGIDKADLETVLIVFDDAHAGLSIVDDHPVIEAPIEVEPDDEAEDDFFAEARKK